MASTTQCHPFNPTLTCPLPFSSLYLPVVFPRRHPCLPLISYFGLFTKCDVNKRSPNHIQHGIHHDWNNINHFFGRKNKQTRKTPYRPFPCARLRSLPFDATLEDILILFQGLVVIDVVLVGQGEAFVVFANPMDYQMALQR